MVPQDSTLKTCSRCRETKSRSEFSVSRAEIDGLCYWCKSCKRAAKKDWASRNRDHLRDYQKEYMDDHREGIRRSNQGQNQPRKNKRIAKRCWNEKNKTHVRSYSRKHRSENPEAYRKLNRRKYLARKGRLECGPGADREFIWERDGGVCYLCGMDIPPGEFGIDHVIPLCRGGTHDESNMKAVHRECNTKKARYLVSELEEMGVTFHRDE